MKILIIIIYLNIGIISLTSYKLFHFEKFGKIISVSDNVINVYHSKNLINSNSHYLTNDRIINTYDESRMISASYYYDDDFKQIYLIIKDHNYFYLPDQFNGNYEINEISNKESNIISYECKYEDSFPICYLFIAIIDDNKNLKILKYKYNSTQKEFSQISNKVFELIDSDGYHSKSKCNNVSCQIMTYSSIKKILSCFYENENSELGVINIDPETLEQDNSRQIKLTKNSGATHIKSALYSNNEKALVCYINDKNNLACIIYEINGNQWLLEYKYIEECSSNIHLFNLDYYSDKNQYLLSCFTNDTNIEYAIFNYQLDINDNSRGAYCLTTMALEYCSSLSSYAVICESNSYFIETSCSSENEEKLSKMSFSENCNKNYNKDIIILDENKDSDTKKIEDKKITDTVKFTAEIKETELDAKIKPSEEIKKKEIIKIETNKTLDEATKNLTKIIEDINLDNIYYMKSKDYLIKINPINYRDLYNNSTHIDFSECEKTLRRVNNISPSKELFLVTVEIYKNDKKSLTNQVEYEVYDDQKRKLDLSVCGNDEIEIYYSISNTSLIDKDKIKYFSDLGIDILNSNDVFFNDICYPYSEKSVDIILNDRIEDIYQNYSMCDNNCNYNKIDLISMTITCKCGTKRVVNSQLEKLTFDHILLDIISNSSIGVVKCYNLVFNFRNKLENIGFWIFGLLFLINASLIAHYFIYGITPIKKYIVNEMVKYNYLNNFQNPNKKAKNDKVNLFNLTNTQPNLHMNKKLKKSAFNNNNINKKFKELNKYNNKKNGFHIKIYKRKLNDSNCNSKEKISMNSINKITSSNNYLKLKLSEKEKTNIKTENQYFMIQINANNSKDNKPPESKFYLNNYDFEEALQYDKRTFWSIYYICLLAKENILNLLYIKSPLELTSLRLCIFVFMYSCDLTFNTLFYFNSNISDRYHYEGKSLFWFSLLNNLSITIISSILSFFLSITLEFLTNSKEDIEEIFRKEEKKMRKDSKYIVSKVTKREILMNIYDIIKILKIKIFFFIIIECTLLLFFFYFVTAFCEVYQKTQISWLCDSFASFILSFPIEFLLAFLNASFYKISLVKKSSLLYKIVMVMYNLS